MRQNLTKAAEGIAANGHFAVAGGNVGIAWRKLRAIGLGQRYKWQIVVASKKGTT